MWKDWEARYIQLPSCARYPLYPPTPQISYLNPLSLDPRRARQQDADGQKKRRNEKKDGLSISDDSTLLEARHEEGKKETARFFPSIPGSSHSLFPLLQNPLRGEDERKPGEKQETQAYPTLCSLLLALPSVMAGMCCFYVKSVTNTMAQH
ncbi:hypothetical protein GGI42DRAFT_119411 [Trichoderma sp. SZMC 28013]